MNVYIHKLTGCAPIPLAHYLKALGILRLVSEQADNNALGWWNKDVFVLQTRLDRNGLLAFFLQKYCPSPIVAPWNGGSGFYPTVNTRAILAIAKSKSDRFSSLRNTISVARRILQRLGVKRKPDQPTKPKLLQACRNEFPEEALHWLDAAYVLTRDEPKYPPLLGTGGNDGRLEFTNNFMQRLIDLIDPATGKATSNSPEWLRVALFGGVASVPTCSAPVGQFYPGLAGGPNATSGFIAKSTVNPWDYVLMLEGALLFAAAAVRRLLSSESARLAYPFCVKHSGAGYSSAALEDETESRAEIWLPLWDRPCGTAELATVFGEGRAQVGSRTARTGIDFARAVVSLGVDRGLVAFQRVGFLVRNGLAYFATPLGRFKVYRNARVDLLSEIDSWFDKLQQIAAAKAEQAPASVRRALLTLENCIISLCQVNDPTRLQAVLVALGQAERALSRSLSWTLGIGLTPSRNRIDPLRGLSTRWLHEVNDNTPEFRLATALASITGHYNGKDGKTIELPLRCHLEPVEYRRRGGSTQIAWAETAAPDVVWHEGDLVDVLNRILARRLLRAEQSGFHELPEKAQYSASLSDVIAFINGETDDARLGKLLWGLSLLDWQHGTHQEHAIGVTGRDLNVACSSTGGVDRDESRVPPTLFSLLRLCFPPYSKQANLPCIPIVPTIHRLAAVGNGLEASRVAVRRLRGCGLNPALHEVHISGETARRIAAALLFPLSHRDFTRLGKLVLKQQTEPKLNL